MTAYVRGIRLKPGRRCTPGAPWDSYTRSVAIPALLEALAVADERDDEAAIRELPEVFAHLGAGAIPLLSEYLSNPANPPLARTLVSAGLLKLAQRTPGQRAACAAAIAAGLAQYASNPQDMNAFLISDLAGLKATEHAGLVALAFAAQRVDQFLIGNFEDFQLDVGLLAERPAPRQDPGWSINPHFHTNGCTEPATIVK